jgi:hypothetical protein
MSRGLGRIGRAITHEIELARQFNRFLGRAGIVEISSWNLLYNVYGKPGATLIPTPAQRKAVTRAMHGFVRRHPEFALVGGQGRTMLYLYELGDPLSVSGAAALVRNISAPTQTGGRNIAGDIL